MKGCELCSAPARMYCESDQASLCWECDSRVHSANFLVARHVRALLCHACQSSTPWKASGSKLGPTVSVCVDCVHGTNNTDQDEDDDHDEEEEEEDGTDQEDQDSDEDEDEDSDENENEEEAEEDEDEDADNQVVPWSATATPPPPPVASSSSSEDSSSRFCFSGGAGARSLTVLPAKRMRHSDDIADIASQDFCCSSSQQNPATQIPTLSSRNSNNKNNTVRKRASSTNRSMAGSETDSNPPSILNAIRKFEQKLLSRNHNTPAMILEMCKLSSDPSSAVDL